MANESHILSGPDLVQLAFSVRPHDLPILTITANTSDFPGKYVTRLFIVSQFFGHRPTTYCSLADSLEEARSVIPEEHFIRFPRDPADDPVIVESWM